MVRNFTIPNRNNLISIFGVRTNRLATMAASPMEFENRYGIGPFARKSISDSARKLIPEMAKAPTKTVINCLLFRKFKNVLPIQYNHRQSNTILNSPMYTNGKVTKVHGFWINAAKLLGKVRLLINQSYNGNLMTPKSTSKSAI